MSHHTIFLTITVMTQQVTSDDALLKALELVVKNVDKISTLRRSSTQTEGAYRIQQLEAEIERVKKVNQTLHKTLSAISTATPQSTVPSDSLVLTAVGHYPEDSIPYDSIFDDGDWPKKLDNHAEMVLSIQAEATGFRVNGIRALENTRTTELEYVADCTVTGGVGNKHTLQFRLVFAIELEGGIRRQIVKYEPGDLTMFTKQQREALKAFRGPYTINRDQLGFFFPFMTTVLRDLDEKDEVGVLILLQIQSQSLAQQISHTSPEPISEDEKNDEQAPQQTSRCLPEKMLVDRDEEGNYTPSQDL
ncbi:hypothetical protein VNI00_004012 [Paramarasmius palmivorus]|uniref:Uncharacterized protein n=1 Tax=Paramarasmius palmivorus TaxID=297713 RepID=A0AAW0DQP5_9AGAR